MNGNHVTVDLGAAIEGFSALWTFVLKGPLMPVPVKFESSSIFERFFASMASQGIQIKERLILDELNNWFAIRIEYIWSWAGCMYGLRLGRNEHVLLL